ncbi:Sortase family protein [Corynebacterium heidelbergense]|nr:Sortase family protein [Corynebacterium heidelbergense]
MPVVPVGVDEKSEMAIPEDPGVAGWYKFGPDLDSPAGSIVLAAHVDGRESGTGPFARLKELREGDEIRLRNRTGTQTFSIEQVEEKPKDQIDFQEVFDRTGPLRLKLITCGGPFDAAARNYTDNIIATAVPKS